MPSSTDNQQTNPQVQHIISHFGHNLHLDSTVLLSVLEMHDNDVDECINFLSLSEDADNRNYFDPTRLNSNSLPPHYLSKPDNWKPPSDCIPSDDNMDVDQDKHSQSLKILFMTPDSSIEQHITALQSEPHLYKAILVFLLHQNVELLPKVRINSLTALWACKHYKFADWLLGGDSKQFLLPEVLKSLKILDAQRMVRQLEKTLQRLSQQKCKPNAKKLAKIQGKINDVKRDWCSPEVLTTSVSGALAKRIRKWASAIPREQLAFFALHLSKKPWQELSDLVHFSPKSFALPEFLDVVFDKDAPDNSMVKQYRDLTNRTVNDVLEKFQIPYSYLRKHLPFLSAETTLKVVRYEKIDVLLWWYEELISDGNQQAIDEILIKRLNAGEVPSFAYGKLMERLLFFKRSGSAFFEKLIPIAEKKLREIDLPLENPIVVLGDSSYSMDVSIRTSTIIASLISVLTKCELKFFNTRSFAPEKEFSNVQEVIELSLNQKADGLTAPACTLWEYYRQKKSVKVFIMVTDEIENEQAEGIFFAQLLYRYLLEVNPQCKMVMVSFREDPSSNTPGRMVNALNKLGIRPVEFRLSLNQIADLSKLDKLIGLLSIETEAFGKRVRELSKIYASSGLEATVDALTNKNPQEDEMEQEEVGEEETFEEIMEGYTPTCTPAGDK
eukprot:CAMPEP_0117437556 /NCGR_PEP_ID=MMETSP0759-20121206/1584_1 /TAXON_ID=63605 /ORGANISM="Percolomonas cosmopolitus, Strain WS" /LENGTH=668 /DNA_ID=CAMNT_0005229191 /DNA_START=19 /DNA_END=2025 /DNA_ORIENTATION=+